MASDPIVYLNGEFLHAADARVSVNDRGFVFGDGIYEVWRVVEGRLFEPARHQARLEHGLRELDIVPPAETKPDAVRALAAKLIEANGIRSGHGTVYMEVTRGAAPRTHQFPVPAVPPTVYAYAKPFVPPEQQRSEGVAAITEPDVRWLRCDIKTIQLLPNVFAKQAATERGAMDAFLVRDGVATEGTHATLFAVVGGTLRTHPLSPLILPGVTRAVVLELARELGIAAEERAVTLDELRAADELFVSGTTTDVTPVVRLDGAAVASGRPGPITRRLYAALSERLAAAGRA